MALIKCKECGKDISGSAAACPQCGAAVPKAVGPNEEQCPHCMSIVQKNAITCQGCGARKGYVSGGNVYGSMLPVFLRIALVIVIGGLFIYPFRHWGGGALSSLGFLIAVVVAIEVIRRLYSLIRGKQWVR